MKNTKLQNPSLRKRKGFTLIELIVVIAILAILAAIAVPAFLGALTRARTNADYASARVLVSSYNVAMAEGTSTFDFDGDPTVPAQLVSFGYLDEIPEPQTDDTAEFIMTFNTDNSVNQVTVGSGGTIVYPKPVQSS